MLLIKRMKKKVLLAIKARERGVSLRAASKKYGVSIPMLQREYAQYVHGDDPSKRRPLRRPPKEIVVPDIDQEEEEVVNSKETSVNDISINDITMETTTTTHVDNNDEIFCKECRHRLTCCLINFSPQTYVLLCVNKQCKRTNMIRDPDKVDRLKEKSARLKEPQLEDVDDVLQSLEEFKQNMKKYMLVKKKLLLAKNNQVADTMTIKEEMNDDYDAKCAIYEEYLKLPFERLPTPAISKKRTKTVFQWQNESNLCWLDVIITMLLNSDVIRLRLNSLKNPGRLHYLCREFDRIQNQQLKFADFGKSWRRFEHTRDIFVIKFAEMFQIKIGEMQCCMDMLKSFLDFDDSVKPTLTSYITRSIKCTDCEYNEVGTKKVVGCLSLLDPIKKFHPLKCLYPATCPECDAEGQTEEIKFKKVGPVFVIHLEKGFPHNRLHEYDFNIKMKDGRKIEYQVFAVIQYKRERKHFILWIRDLQMRINKRTNNTWKWMKLDDGDVEETTCWQSTTPIIPQHEIHMVMWSKKGARKLLHLQSTQRAPFLRPVDCTHVDIFLQSEDEEESDREDCRRESTESQNASIPGSLHSESTDDRVSDNRRESTESENSIKVRTYGLRKRQKFGGKVIKLEMDDEKRPEENHELEQRRESTESQSGPSFEDLHSVYMAERLSSLDYQKASTENDSGSNCGDSHPEIPEESHRSDLGHRKDSTESESTRGGLHSEDMVPDNRKDSTESDSDSVVRMYGRKRKKLIIKDEADDGENHESDLGRRKDSTESGSNPGDLRSVSTEDVVSNNRKESTESDSSVVRRYSLRKRKLVVYDTDAWESLDDFDINCGKDSTESGPNRGDSHPKSPQLNHRSDLGHRKDSTESGSDLHLEDRMTANRKDSAESDSSLGRRYSFRKRRKMAVVDDETDDEENSDLDCTENEKSSPIGRKNKFGVVENLAFFRKLRIPPPLSKDEMVSEARCQELRERAWKMRDSTYMRMNMEKFEKRCEHYIKVHELMLADEAKEAAMKAAKAAVVEAHSGAGLQVGDAKDRSIKVRRIANVVCIGYKELEVPHILPPITLPKIAAPPITPSKFSYLSS